ncbi:MAG: N-acetyltransferase family protein [Clostridia bacterium]
MLEFQIAGEALMEWMRSLYNHYVETSTATFHMSPVDRESFRRMMFSDVHAYPCFIMSDEGKTVGYCALCPFSDREAYRPTAEVSIYIHPDMTGKGYGSSALDYLEEQAREKGFCSLVARICSENALSCRIFEKKGFRRVGCLKEVGLKFGRLLDVNLYQMQL